MNPDTNNSSNQEPVQPTNPVAPNVSAGQPIQPPVVAHPIDNDLALTAKKSRKRIVLIIILVIIAILIGLAILGPHLQKQLTTDTTPSLVKNTDINKLTTIDTDCYSLKVPTSYVQRNDLDPKVTCFVDTNETASQTSGVNNNDTLVQSTGSARSEPSTLPSQKTGAITLDQAFDYVKTNLIPKELDNIKPENGSLKNEKLLITLGGIKAYRTNFNGGQSKTLVFITAVPPHPYTVYGQTVNFFDISLSTSANNGEQILQTMINSWQWM